MSVTSPAFKIRRQDLGNYHAHWVKLIAPPSEKPPTPEKLHPTNPVPEFMARLGLADVGIPHTLEPDLMHDQKLKLWDGKEVKFFLFRHKHLKSPFNKGFYPAPTIRVPRGVIFHAKTHGHGPPPHTIHWHGIEPTPMNDGVGHCSFEIGEYTYQWQPNYCGTYFYHCHRHTVQHYKFGLYGALIIEPPNAFDSGPGRNPGGYPRRAQANTSAFSKFPGFIGGGLSSDRPEAMTVPYDVEALWAIDDIDSRWQTIMTDPRADGARPGNKPGVNDEFAKADFHDYNPDYFFVSGVSFRGRAGTVATLPEVGTIPPALNSGVSGMQINVVANRNKTILIRIISAAYSILRIRLPLDGVIISYDGRALGVPPWGKYNRPIPLTAGEVMELTTARRCEILLRSSTQLNSFVEVQYLNHRDRSLIFTGKIPIRII